MCFLVWDDIYSIYIYIQQELEVTGDGWLLLDYCYVASTCTLRFECSNGLERHTQLWGVCLCEGLCLPGLYESNAMFVGGVE